MQPVAVRQVLEKTLRGPQVQFPRVLLDSETRAQARQDGQPARKPHVEGVDGLDAQPPRIAEQVPAEPAIDGQCVPRQLQRALMQTVRPAAAVARRAQRTEDAVAHFRCGLAREGDGEHGLGRLHRRQQREVASRQELGLARTGRGLDDEAPRHVERRLARPLVRLAQVSHRLRPRPQRPDAIRRYDTKPRDGSTCRHVADPARAVRPPVRARPRAWRDGAATPAAVPATTSTPWARPCPTGSSGPGRRRCRA